MSAHELWLLRLYPRQWRQRYEEEFVALLEGCPRSPLVLLDVLLGALDAHIAPQDNTGRILQMINRPRWTAITVFCAYIVFVVAGFGFQKMTEYDDFVEAARSHAAIGISFDIVVAGSAVALLAVLAGGLPIAFAALKYALAARRWDIPLLFLVPPVALAVWIGHTILLTAVLAPAHHGLSLHTFPGVLLIPSWFGVFALAAIASTAAVSLAIARSNIDARVFRFALGPATIATLAMVTMFIAVVVWGVSLRADAPQLFNGDGGILATSTAASWLAQVTIMGIATAIAVGSLVRGTGSRAEAQPA
jgi:hypothetical protein